MAFYTFPPLGDLLLSFIYLLSSHPTLSLKIMVAKLLHGLTFILSVLFWTPTSVLGASADINEIQFRDVPTHTWTNCLWQIVSGLEWTDGPHIITHIQIFHSATFFFQNGLVGECGQVHRDSSLIAAIGEW